MAWTQFWIFVLLKIFTSNCQNLIQRRINGGNAPSPISVKYLVSLQTPKGQHFCGGSLVHRYWVLTAAHCNMRMDQMMIVAGDNILGKYEGMEQYSKPHLTIPHPLYNKSTNNADIMLIKLRAPIKLNNYVSLALLPKQNTAMLPGQLCQVSGWGSTSQPTLETLGLPIISTAKCNSSESLDGKITANMICARYRTGSRDACKVDPGGPLVCNGRLYGLVSWGQQMSCEDATFPGVYTSVARFRRWIDRTIYRSFIRCYKYRRPFKFTSRYV
ncbi:trypsin-3 [Trichomycterus rosablanca]|uniref:trypsin-3 n=1 Tax=Trichomycterus rosablanca TaxID=2290929 RepID=UPI002F359EFB